MADLNGSIWIKLPKLFLFSSNHACAIFECLDSVPANAWGEEGTLTGIYQGELPNNACFGRCSLCLALRCLVSNKLHPLT
jgi:hypothetical protein